GEGQRKSPEHRGDAQRRRVQRQEGVHQHPPGLPGRLRGPLQRDAAGALERQRAAFRPAPRAVRRVLPGLAGLLRRARGALGPARRHGQWHHAGARQPNAAAALPDGPLRRHGPRGGARGPLRAGGEDLARGHRPDGRGGRRRHRRPADRAVAGHGQDAVDAGGAPPPRHRAL
ncbi:MAG: DNA protection during starvation protein, partial [uncultured Acetobacteraceae bacterium]